MISDKDIFNARVLIVDDRQDNVALLEKVLNNEGYTSVLSTTDSRETLDLCESFKPDIIMLDINMPYLDGFQVMAKLRESGLGMTTSIIVITAQHDHETRLRSLREGAKDFLTKPFDQSETLTRIRNMLEVRLLQNRMREQNKILDQKRKEAEDATKLKDKFVALVAHDLKSPFNSILGCLQIIYSDKKNPLFPKHKELIDRALMSGRGLLNMIEELLKINRLQTGKITLKKKFFDAYLLAAYAAVNLKHLAEEKKIELINDIPRGTRIFADKDLFGEVIQNLVSNAIKFCSKGDRITMFVLPDNEKATFVVKDTGTGINEEVLPKLFLHGETTSTTGTAGEKGTGLGLPFSHDIVQAHNGSLRVESKEGEGSVFYAELPIVHPKILIVDDSEVVRDMIREQLQDLSLDFDEAENGKEALKYLESNIPHLILLDIEMPVMSGLELLEHIRKNPETKQIPVIIVTVRTSLADREKAFHLGASDFISKPFVLEDAIPRIRRFVG